MIAKYESVSTHRISEPFMGSEHGFERVEVKWSPSSIHLDGFTDDGFSEGECERALRRDDGMHGSGG